MKKIESFVVQETPPSNTNVGWMKTNEDGTTTTHTYGPNGWLPQPSGSTITISTKDPEATMDTLSEKGNYVVNSIDESGNIVFSIYVIVLDKGAYGTAQYTLMLDTIGFRMLAESGTQPAFKTITFTETSPTSLFSIKAPINTQTTKSE